MEINLTSWNVLPRPPIIFGCGRAQEAGKALEQLGVNRALVVMTGGGEVALFEEKIRPFLGAVKCEVCCEVVPDPPIDLVEKIVASAKQSGVDGVLAVGGGSAIDAAKIVAALIHSPQEVRDIIGENKITGNVAPLIAIPTTAGTGSEVTHIAILSEPGNDLKKGVVSPKIVPQLAILDPELTQGMPPSLTANTGLDALSHAVEAFVSKNASIFSDTFAIKAIELLVEYLPKAFNNPLDLEARGAMLLGSHMAGIAFSNAGVTAAHAFAYPIGARFHIPHGASVLLMLPAVLEFSAIGNEARFCELGQILNRHSNRDVTPLSAVAVINQLCRDLAMPDNLKAVGVPEDGLLSFAQSALTVERLLKNNRRPIDSIEKAIRIYERAFNYDRMEVGVVN